MMSRYVEERYVGMVVSLPRGVEAILDGREVFNLREAHFPMASMGLLHVCRINKDGWRLRRAGRTTPLIIAILSF